MSENLRKKLTLFDVFCIASGAMISSGLFILPGIASANVGPSLFLSYIIASFLVIPAVFSKAELTTAMPKAGGDYFYITRSMGLAVGTISGASTWFSLSLKGSFALVGMGAYISLITNLPIEIIAVFLCLIFIIINVIGVKEAGIFQRILVIGLLFGLFAYIFYGFRSVQLSRFTPFTPFGGGAVFATAGVIFISYGGLTKVASIAEEIKNPGRNIPLGMFFALIIVSILYALVIFVTSGILEPDKLYNSLTPISDGAHVSMGIWGGIIMAIAAILAFVSTANAGIMSASRYPIAMSRDKILPSFFSKINVKFNTPHISVIFTGIFMILSILLLDLEILVRTASTFLILIFIFSNIAVVIMRESKIQNYQPKFKSPLYPWMQIAGILTGLFLIFEMGLLSYIIVGIFIFVGLIWYFIYVRPNTKQEFALIHIIERITAKDLTSNFLGSELREILKERDDIVEDRFDYLIKQAYILDLKESISVEDFFKRVACILGEQLDIDSYEIFYLLKKREEESSTVIRPGLAIPHIVVKGKNKFNIFLARCKKGINFPGDKKVYAVFVLVGTKDERNFHLRALSAIAQVAQNPNFDEAWFNAKGEDELRDIILLAERRRIKKK